MKKIFIVGHYTFKELLKSNILLNVFFIGLGLMLAVYIATEFTYGVPERVAIDFGIGMLSVSSLAISLFLGVTLLSKEIESRTIYMIISRPVSRNAFIIGKILGLMAIQLVNVLLLSSMTLVATKILGGELSSLIFWAVGFIFIESFLLLLIVSLISLFANTVLTVLMSVALLLLGYAIPETKGLGFVQRRPLVNALLDFYHFILPAFYKLNLKEFLIYKKSLPLSYLISSGVYGLTYSFAILFLILAIFKRKNLD